MSERLTVEPKNIIFGKSRRQKIPKKYKLDIFLCSTFLHGRKHAVNMALKTVHSIQNFENDVARNTFIAMPPDTISFRYSFFPYGSAIIRHLDGLITSFSFQVLYTDNYLNCTKF